MPLTASGTTTIDKSGRNVSFKGKSNIGQKLAKYDKSMEDAIKHALFITGGRLESDSVKITPVHTGELRSRAFTDEVTEENGKYSIVVGYERTDTEYYSVTDNGNAVKMSKYAVYVHEREDLHHNVGQAKFLETASKSFASNYARAVQTLLVKEAKP